MLPRMPRCAALMLLLALLLLQRGKHGEALAATRAAAARDVAAG